MVLKGLNVKLYLQWPQGQLLMTSEAGCERYVLKWSLKTVLNAEKLKMTNDWKFEKWPQEWPRVTSEAVCDLMWKRSPVMVCKDSFESWKVKNGLNRDLEWPRRSKGHFSDPSLFCEAIKSYFMVEVRKMLPKACFGTLSQEEEQQEWFALSLWPVGYRRR